MILLHFGEIGMFASDPTLNNVTAPMTLSVRPAVHSGERRGFEPKVARSWPSNKPSIHLRECEDEPALEYGCVDWFIYENQQPQ
jgi:hypothetical protein